MANWGAQHTQSSQKSIYNPLFLPSFPIYFSLFFIGAHGWWIDNGEALEWSGRLGHPIAAAHPAWVPPGRVGFWVPRDIVGVSCVSRSQWGSSGDVSCISHSGGKRSECRHSLGVGRPKSRLDTTLSDLAPNRCGDLFKRQHNCNTSGVWLTYLHLHFISMSIIHLIHVFVLLATWVCNIL
jgi:hypothetical protein